MTLSQHYFYHVNILFMFPTPLQCLQNIGQTAVFLKLDSAPTTQWK